MGQHHADLREVTVLSTVTCKQLCGAAPLLSGGKDTDC